MATIGAGGEVLLSWAEPATGNSMMAVPSTTPLTAMAAARKSTSLFSRIEMLSAARAYPCLKK
jgi:hypothetical protein